MKNNYPSAGWNVEWKNFDNREIHFDMTSCVYADTTALYGCPELCPVFCANDDTAFKGYRPSIIFERNGTIARGQSVCDFHYKNSKR